MKKIVQMRQRGSITIPTELRNRYQLADGDPLTIADLGEFFFDQSETIGFAQIGRGNGAAPGKIQCNIGRINNRRD